jgi:hypothetical protein
VLEQPVGGRGAADQRLRGGHATLGRALGATDALELGARLDAPAGLDGLAVDLDRDARASQLVGQRHGQVGGHRRALDPPPLHGAQRDLELRLLARPAVNEHLEEPQLLAQHHVGVGERVGDPGRLEQAGEDRRAAVLHDDEQRVDDLQRHLVPHRRIPDRVAVEQDRGHAAEG